MLVYVHSPGTYSMTFVDVHISINIFLWINAKCFYIHVWIMYI